jgi:hypothetical protein
VQQANIIRFRVNRVEFMSAEQQTTIVENLPVI